MNCQKLFNTVDELNEKYLNIWEDVCNIESPTDYKEGVDECGRYFIKIAEEKGWKVEVCKQDVAGDVICITMNPEINERPVSFSGHLDTVHPVGLFGIPAVRRDDTYIYGPGVKDCKGGVVGAFLAMDALNRIGFDKRPVQLLLQSDEEKGCMPSGKTSIQYICQKAKDAVAFINLEGHTPHKAFVSTKGILRVKFNITGKAAHSSRCMEGSSAISEAAHKLLEMETLKDLDALTCNCGVIEGGTVANTVAEKCSFIADIRFATEGQLNEAWEKINKVARTVCVEGCTCEVEKVSFRPAMERAQRNLDLLDTVNNIFKNNSLPVLEDYDVKGATDAAYITIAEIPCLDGFGTEGDFIHSIKECSRLDSLASAAKRMAAIAYEI